MPADTTLGPPDPLDALAESFLNRCRAGEQPDIDDYARRHPELAERIRDLFPTLATLEHASSPPGAPECPERLGEYRILRCVGQGGMGVVYEAIQEPLSRHVALKVLLPGMHSHPTVLERFQQEARTAARLQHANIVPVYDVGTDGGRFYFAMQFIAGAGLDRVIDELVRRRASAVTVHNAGSSSWLSGPRGDYHLKAAALAAQAADALAYAHDQGVLHRDIKPSNLLLDPHGTLWVADFGLAKEIGGEDLTSTGAIVGTLRYLAPERFNGEADARSDVYSLGVTLYELLTLRPAFDASDRAALIRQVTQGEVLPPRRLDASIPADLETVVLKALAREPAGRYATAAAFADDLRNVVAGRPVKARRASAPARLAKWTRRNPTVAGLSAAVAGLVIVMAVASTIAAAMYKAQRDAARASERQANVHLLESLIAQADASRRGNRSGQRVHTIEILQRAAAMADRLGVTKLDDRIRDLAIAAIGLPDIAVGRRLPGVVPLGCWGAVVDDTMSRYAVADAAGTLTIRRVDDNAEIGRLPVTGDSDLTFGPGGRFLGMWTRSPGLLTVWDVDAGPPRKVVEQTGVRSPLFHPDGRSLVVVTGQGDVLVFELPSGRRTASHPAVALTREVTIALHPRQPWIALCSYFHERVLVRHLGSGAVIAELPFSGYSTPWSADGRWLAVTGGDELTIRVVDTRTWQVVRTLESPTGGMIARFDPTGQFIVGYGWDGSFRAWDRTGTRQAFATPISGSHCRLGFARDGRTFAQTRDDSDLCCWEVHAGAERREFRPAGRLNERLTGMFAIHPAGRLFAVGGVRGLQFWDLATGEELPAVVPGENVYAPAFCEHEFMCWGSFPSKVWRFPALTSNDANGFRFGPPECVSDFSAALSVSRDGRVTTLQCRPVAATQNFAGVWIRRSDGPARPVHIPCRGEHERSVVSPDGRLAVIGVVGPNNLQVVDTRDGRPLKSLDVSGYFSNAAFAGDGRMLVTMGDRLTVWHTGPDIADWRRGPEIESPCAAADVHPGLPIIASSKPDGIVRLHDSNTGEEIACLEAPEAAGQVAFSPDGARLCVLHSGGSVSSWELARLGRELRRVGLDRGTTPFPNCPEPKDGPDAEPLRVEFTGLWQMQPELAIVAGMVRSLGRPTDQTLRELGRGLARLRAYPLSRAAYEALTRRRPDDAEAAYELGLAAVERRDWSTALDRLRLAASDPQLHDVARLVRAALLRHINRPAEADAEVQSLRAVNGLDSVAYYSEAAAFLDEARFGPAALLFEEAHRRAPGEGLYLMNGALLWLAAPPPWGDPAKALAWAQRATEKNANRSRSQWAAGLALLKHGRLTEASLTLNQLRAHGEADYVAGALYALAQVHDRRGDRPAAAACWHEAEAKYPAARVTALLGLPPSVVRSIESARRGAAAALNQAPAPNPP